ncbi:MAG: MmcQ/YjbR family DNA-binding protein [Clostridia bacterium]|nr:MmcQ/YjbR family DNA-binding protein [Clostridia bacterium]
MNRSEVIAYLLSKPFARETYPFDEVTPVYKVGGKMFALISNHTPNRLCINLKNTPDQNVLMREIYKDVIPGYHMNKTHWNSVFIDGALNHTAIERMIDDSYDLVFNSLTKKIRKEIEDI